MLAYQMIYTACGKEKKGDFSVWSQSAELTKQECDAIAKFMIYKIPKDAPYEPNEEELKTLFPREYGYFELSTGKKCIARSVYLSKVYSDRDMRLGNYIIHAYVFDNLEGANPYGIFANDTIFKDGLTYEEWHENPAPESLPAIELKLSPVLMLDEISQFIENGKREILESLLQAVLDAAKNDDAIIFNDSEANQRKLYGIIGTVIPDVFRGSLTFATHYVERYAPEEVTAKPVKIRSMFPDIINKAFKYEEAISAGKKAFWFEKNIYSRIAPGRYVKDIIESVLNGNSKFDILTKVQTISRIIDKTGCDADTAISIYYLTKKNLEWFESADEFNKAFTLAAAYKYINEAEIAKQLYDEVLSVGKWGIRSTILPQLKFIYPYCDIGTKGNIISDYINNIYEYGARDGKELSCLVEYIKREAPFSWEDFARFLLLDPSWEKYINNVHTGAEEYLVFSGLCTAMYVNKDDRNALAKGYSLTKIIFTQAINKRNIEDIKQYWSLITTFGRQNESWFLKNCASRYFETALTDEDSLRYALSLLMLMSNGTEKESMLYSFLHKNVNNAGMLSTYIEFAGKNKAFFAEFEHKYARDSVIADFLFKKSGYEFMNSSVVTFDLLKNYYETYFRRGYDKGTFKIKVMEYVKSCKDEKSRFDACINIYNMIKSLPDSEIADLIFILSRESVSSPGENLLTRMAAQKNDILEMNNRLVVIGKQVPENFKLMYVALVCKTVIYDGSALAGYLADDMLYSKLDNRELAEFVRGYFGYALDLYVYCRKKLQAYIDKNSLIKAVFLPPFNVSARIADNVELHINKMEDEDEYSLIICDLMLYNGPGCNMVESFVRRHIANVDKKRIKYINKFVKRHITDERQIERVEQILGTQKKSAGLLSKLFGDLFKNNDKNKNGR